MRSLLVSALLMLGAAVPLAGLATAQETEMQPLEPLTIDFETQGCGRFKQEAYYRTEFQFVNVCRGEASLIMVVTDNDGLGRERIPVEKQVTANGLRFTGTSDRNIQYGIDNQTLTILFPGQQPYREQVTKVSFTPLANPKSTDPAPKPMSMAAVTGTVVYRQRIALPPNAVVKVRLQDVSRADAPAILLDEQIIPTNGKQVPFAFTLNYDPNQIKPNHAYAVSAQILIDGNRNPTSNVTVMVNQVRAGN